MLSGFNHSESASNPKYAECRNPKVRSIWSNVNFAWLEMHTETPRCTPAVALDQNVGVWNKLAQKSFASPGKICCTSKTKDKKIVLYIWPYALEF